MPQNYVLYQEIVEMPNKEIGINAFYYDCVNAPSTGIFPLHWHKCLEIIAVVDGWLEIEIERQKYIIEAGSVTVVNPSQLHYCEHYSRDTKLFCVIIDLSLFRGRYMDSMEEKYIAPLKEGRVIFPPYIPGNTQLVELIRDCSQTFCGQAEAYQIRLKALLYQMLYVLFTQCGDVRCDEQKNPDSLSRERVNTILQYVDEHYAERIKLDDLVAILHINKYYICKIFQQHIGRTFLDYVNLVRIQKAVEMIVSTNDSITTIAFATGFQDINYFSRIFKRIMGISPTQLRKQHRQEPEG